MTYTIDHSHQSPNHSGRQGAPITLLVIHATVGPYDASLAWLCNPASKVSTHYLIRKDGHIAQLVPDDLAAWHAGVSAWHDLDSGEIQRQSIGIELENKNNGLDPYPPAQMTALLALSRDLVATYHIAPDMVTRHLDIAIPKGRKSDPAGFPWLAFKASLYEAAARPYRVVGLPVYQAANHTGALWGHLNPGQRVTIDDPSNGHIATVDGAPAAIGFVDINGLETT